MQSTLPHTQAGAMRGRFEKLTTQMAFQNRTKKLLNLEHELEDSLLSSNVLELLSIEVRRVPQQNTD